MQARRFILLTLGVTAIAACERGSTPAVDSVALATPPDVDAPWVPELGPLFAIHGDSDGTAILLVPPAPGSLAQDATLFRTAGDSVATARVTIPDPDMRACGDAPVARLSATGPSGWTIAFAPGVSALKLDSIERLSPADSLALAADVSRLASGLRSGAESRFSGLPFAVLGAHRVLLGGQTIIVGRVARRIPQEATPLEERTLVVGEQAPDGRVSLKYSLRSAGAEDSVEHHLLLGAVQAGDMQFFVLESERDTGTRYEILERSANGTWRLRWSRALSC